MKQLRLGLRPEVDGQTRLSEELETILEPIYAQERCHHTLPPGPERDEKLQELIAMYRDMSIAEKLFETMGSNYCTNIAIKRAIAGLKHAESSDIGYDPMAINTWFEIPALQKHLAFTERQKQVVSAKVKQANDEFMNESGKLFEHLSKLSSDRWEDILDVLDRRQRELAVNVIGPPIEWFRLRVQPEFRKNLDSVGNLKNAGSFYGSTTLQIAKDRAAEKAWSLSRSLNTLTPKELKDLGIIELDPLLFELIFCKDLWNEMKFSDKQKEELSGNVATEIKKTLYYDDDRQYSRLEQLLAEEADCPHALSETVLPFQEQRLMQVEVQTRVGPDQDSSCGILHPMVKKVLGISSDQARSIRSIAESFESEQRDALDKIRDLRKEFRTRLSDNIVSSLNMVQMEEFEKFAESDKDE